ncbi:TIGR04348 family glycosyltransferase [Limnobacter humi]|uniref:TIGR04348 family glycosyltransferase n=1 Tax=Limnobacter humi TaxID=1778671 RepID=A0ABT1WC23_9BURK|nr:selenoneine biosynthesis selenosugar synthase SenB [Limnobacter humi]MCQ8895062.1 TIGR04348 family glycosyltransferase [Limnobacter humi]
MTLANKSSVVIVSPALADSNNGNWQTARRWQKLLQSHYRVRVIKQWPDHANAPDEDCLMLALHARRSASSIAAWAKHRHSTAQTPGLVVALTGTDLYKDLPDNADAQQSLQLASQLIVLQDEALNSVPAQHRHKTHAVFQSTTSRPTLDKTRRHLHAIAVGHLRAEKQPDTLMDAAALLAGQPGIYLTHVGAALETAYANQAQQTMAMNPNYRWLGALAHELTRKRIQRAHLLVHMSKMEGGAHVVMEAVTSGTPVLASNMEGNVGMLGRDYAGYFEVGNSAQLARLLQTAQADVRAGCPAGSLMHTLRRQCAARARLFTASAEQTALLNLIDLELKTHAQH